GEAAIAPEVGQFGIDVADLEQAGADQLAFGRRRHLRIVIAERGEAQILQRVDHDVQPRRQDRRGVEALFQPFEPSCHGPALYCPCSTCRNTWWRLHSWIPMSSR